MPELPEVHTIACGLAPALTGRRISSVDALWPGSVRGERELFFKTVPGATITRVHRRAKLLLMDLDREHRPLVLAFHLKMTGGLYTPESGRAPDKHTRIVFGLAPDPERPGDLLLFNDMRKFGYCRAFGPGQLEEWDFYRSLGPEPLETTPEQFAARFKGRQGRVKGLLLDQRVIAGIGNIYADESLHRAGIRPTARACDLSGKRLDRLHREVVAVLKEAIEGCGSSIRDYRDSRGQAGAFQNKFRVYGRAGEPCLGCGKPLEKTTVAGRTSVYCPRCQRA